MKNIYLIVGKSGSGKTTIASMLEKQHGFKQLQSYTTRPPRFQNETGHVFVSDDEFDKLQNIVAFTEFDGYRYCAAKAQTDSADLYIIDPDGVDYFLSHYDGEKGVAVLYVKAPYNERKLRMYARGDNKLRVAKRLAHDEKAFNEALYHVVFVNDDIDKCVAEIYEYINEKETGGSE